ncbi:MAG: hypothetical protein HUK40_14255 [Desulfobacter sp.]|nr:hypothetical protein [Desulfobacter sp.]
MIKSVGLKLMAVAVIVLLSSVVCQAREWERLGAEKLREKGNQIEIGLAGSATAYSALKFGVQNGPIHIKRMIAYSELGIPYEFDIEAYIKPGEFSPSVDISNPEIVLDRITLIYYTKKRVDILVYGMTSPEKAD